MATLEEAILLAVQAHHGQMDKGGFPYILHPLRIMSRMRTETEMIVAVLHDVIEDTEVTLDDLREKGFSDEVIAAVDSLSRRENESYKDFIKRIKLNPLAVQVKFGDLEDNMDIRRLNSIDDADRERLMRYLQVWNELAQMIDNMR